MKKDSRSYVTIPYDLTNIPIVRVPERYEKECIVKIKEFGKFFSHYFFKFGEIYNHKDSRSLAKPKQKQLNKSMPRYIIINY